MNHFIPDRQTALARSAKNKSEVRRMHPEAVEIITVRGGWLVIEEEKDHDLLRTDERAK